MQEFGDNSLRRYSNVRYRQSFLCRLQQKPYQISEWLQSLTQCKENPYGRMPIVFLGDFNQLAPVKQGKSIIEFPQSYFWEEAITNLVEFKQQHQFRNCPHM
jgi:hypothetical protein